MNKILIVYYSHSGNTKKIADVIKRKTGGDIFFAIPRPRYPENYEDTLEVSKQQKEKGEFPKLVTKLNNLDAYDYIFIGTPNWWSTMAPPILAFLNTYDLSNKRIIPFITHGGGGIASIIKDMKQICSKSIFLKEFSVSGDDIDGVEYFVENWLSELFFINN